MYCAKGIISLTPHHFEPFAQHLSKMTIIGKSYVMVFEGALPNVRYLFIDKQFC